MILPEEVDPYTGEGRPARPDLPWFRNLSWTKIHAAQIGLAVGLLSVGAVFVGEMLIAFSILFYTALFTFSVVQVDQPGSSCNHLLGVHDLRRKPWYGISAVLAVWCVSFVVLF